MTIEPSPDGLSRETGAPPPAFVAGVRWGGRDILLVGGLAVVWLFVVALIVAVAIAVAGLDQDSPEALAAQLLITLAWDAGIIVIVRRWVVRKGSHWRDLGFRLPARGLVSGLVPTILVAYVASTLAVQAYGLLLNLLNLESLLPSQQLPDDVFEHDLILAGLALVGVSLVPVAEEIFFRGFFFAGLRRRMAFPLAAGISGFCFSLAHADPGLIIPFTIVGMIFAYVYERTGSLLAPIGVHVLFNSVSFLVLILVPEAR